MSQSQEDRGSEEPRVQQFRSLSCSRYRAALVVSVSIIGIVGHNCLSSSWSSSSSLSSGDALYPMSAVITDREWVPSFSKHVGNLPREGYLLTESLRIEQAEAKCATFPRCRGFSVNSEEVSSDQPVEVHFNSGLGVDETVEGWISYIHQVDSPYPVVDCAQLKGPNNELVHPDKMDAIAQAGFRQCISVLGILVAVTDGADLSAARYIANALGELLDADCDGVLDDPDVAGPLSVFGHFGYSPVLAVGVERAQEEVVPVSTWTVRVASSGAYLLHAGFAWATVRPLIAERVFHFVHLHGWSRAYAEQFGFPSQWNSATGSSNACECMKEAQCIWYQNPTNQGCKSSSGAACKNPLFPEDETSEEVLPGTCRQDVELSCADPECSCSDFLRKVFVAYTGELPVDARAFIELDIEASARRLLRDEDAPARRASEWSVADNMLMTPRCSQMLRDLENTSLAFPKTAVTLKAETRSCSA